ncbi:MAG: DUF1566 domain-containing protein [Gammaproteobacteria bacterium]|nr:DUF1566 domain-containing protein [Gammaproteobacteria bacterium]
MAKVIYLSGNYVVVTDANNVDRVFPIGKTVYEETAGNFLISEGQVEREQLIIPVSDAVNWVDNDGTNYTEATFRDFLRTNTGFRPASGGSGAAPAGATLMKTNQLVSYATGDDGDIQAGRAVDFFTLASNNPFGTTERFTDYLGGQAYNIGVLIDWSTYDGNTVLGYSGVTGASGYIDWATAISSANNHSEGTFTSGWRLPNLKEWNNIFNLNIVYGFSYTPFTNNSFGGSWARRPSWLSSTSAQYTGGAYYADCFTGEVKRTSKTNASGQHAFAVRDFTVNGTTLT